MWHSLVADEGPGLGQIGFRQQHMSAYWALVLLIL